MAVIAAEEYNQPRVLDLGGPDGNAYTLLGLAHGLLKRTKHDPDIFIQIMKADDYGHLVRTFNEMFGDYFTIVLPPDAETLDDL